MRLGIDCLGIGDQLGGPSAVVRSLTRALAPAFGADDALLLYMRRKAEAELLPSGGTVRQVRPFWPNGMRTGRILYRQFRLHDRVFRDFLQLLFCPDAIIPRFSVLPTVLAVHDALALRSGDLVGRKERSFAERYLPFSLRRATRVTTPTEFARSELLAWNAAQEKPITDLDEKIRVIPWGVDARFRPVEEPAEKERIALRYGLPPEYVLYVGPFAMRENMIHVVQGWFAARMSAGAPHRLVMVVSDDIASLATKRLIRELGQEENVIVLREVPDADMPAIYSGATALLLPSLAARFGMVGLEAMACGTPVVASALPVLRETLGDAARFVQPGDLPELRIELEALLKPDDSCADLIEAGRTRAAGYSWEAYRDRALEMFSELIRQDRDSRG